jgi:hypothetical protein
MQYVHTPQQPNKPLPRCCAQRAGVSDSKYDVSLSVVCRQTLHAFVTDSNSNPNFVLPNQESHLGFPFSESVEDSF